MIKGKAYKLTRPIPPEVAAGRVEAACGLEDVGKAGNEHDEH